MSSKSISSSNFWDQFGISLSTVCAIHCLLVPVIVVFLPLTALTVFITDWLHPIFILLMIPSIYFAAKRSHYDKKIVRFLVSGLALVTVGWFFYAIWHLEAVEIALTITGSILLIRGHWLNYRHHRVCKNKTHVHHNLEMNIMEKMNGL